MTDTNFVGGGDQVRYELLAPTSRGPYRLEAKLLYQAIGQRFAAELLEYDTPEIRSFERYFDEAARAPEELSSLSTALP